MNSSREFDRHRPILLAVVLHLSALVSIQALSNSLPYIQILDYPLLLTQCGLVATWMVFGKAQWAVRVFVGLIAWAALSFYFGRFALSIWEAALLGGDMSAVFLALKLIRVRGGTIVRPLPRFAAVPRPGQFTILGLSFLMAIIACLLAGGQWLIHWIPPPTGTSLFGPRLFAINLVFGTAMAVVQIAMLWAVLSPYRVAWRLAATAVVILFAGTGVRILLSHIVEFDAFSVESRLVEGAAIFACTLIAVRAAGYRWETTRPAAVAVAS